MLWQCISTLLSSVQCWRQCSPACALPFSPQSLWKRHSKRSSAVYAERLSTLCLSLFTTCQPSSLPLSCCPSARIELCHGSVVSTAIFDWLFAINPTITHQSLSLSPTVPTCVLSCVQSCLTLHLPSKKCSSHKLQVLQTLVVLSLEHSERQYHFCHLPHAIDSLIQLHYHQRPPPPPRSASHTHRTGNSTIVQLSFVIRNTCWNGSFFLLSFLWLITCESLQRPKFLRHSQQK